MAYFPLFIDLKDTHILIAGAGETARKKAEKLLAYQARITVVDPKEAKWAAGDKIQQIHARFDKPMIHKADLVIAATDDHQLNAQIARDCAAQNKLCNAVDDKESSSFIFGSTILMGDLSIGICTSGSSPSASMYLKAMIQDQIPEQIPEILAFLNDIRPEILQSLKDESSRSAVFHTLFDLCLQKKRPLTAQEWTAFKTIYLNV